jgi:eukaryotic-like serine/threonine-protein kinase
VTQTVTHTPASLAPGGKLDRYELVCPIAEGGMARVWVARLRGKHGFEKLVAIKTILPRFAGDPRFREMFLDEARIASRIDHPNVAQIFDLGEEREVLYLVMEYVDGDALSKLNRSCQKKGVPIPAGIVLRVLADACAGLHEAHELKGPLGRPLGIVHRDVSPHNVLCSTRGIVKIIDFGIAQTDTGDRGTADSGVLKGKIQYMAPEQALGRTVDRRADVWAVGAILYHLLASKAPYEGETQLATLHLLGSGVPPQPLPPDVHPAIAAVARKALAYEPAKRYATAAELRDAIERAMIVAQLTTTCADVSAFSAEHLAERAQRRRDAIERALAAAAERTRAEGASAITTWSGEMPALATSPNPLPSEAFDARTRSAARVSAPPPGARSYATLGSAALDASRPLAASAKARKPALTLLAFALGLAVVAGASMTLLHPRRLAGASPLAAARGAMDPTAGTTSAVSPASLPTSPGGLASSLPSSSASSLPEIDVRATPPPTPRTAPEKRGRRLPRPRLDEQ